MRGTPLGIRLFTRPALVAAVTASAWNNADQSGGITVSGAGLIANNPSGLQGIRSTPGFTGKQYYEVLINSVTGKVYIGVADASATFTDFAGAAGGPSKGASIGSDQVILANGTLWGGTPPAYTAGDRIGVAVDVTNKLVWFAINNTYVTGNPSAGTGGFSISTVTAPLFAYFGGNGGAQNVTLKSAAASLLYTPPTGFTALG